MFFDKSTKYFHISVITITSLLCYYNSINCDFVFDDISAIKDNKDLRPESSFKQIFLNDFWGTPMQKEQSHKSYRPLCVLTFRWNYFFHELNPMGYHAVNVFLHGIVCVMFYNMCRIFLRTNSSFVAAMLFSVHPIHTEAVTGVVGRAEILSSVFFLAAFTFYTKAIADRSLTIWLNMCLSMVSVATAMLCKEQGITVTGVCFVYEIFVAQNIRLKDLAHCIGLLWSEKGFTILRKLAISRAAKRLAILIVTTLMLLYFRLQIMDSQLPVFTKFDNPASTTSTPSRQLTYSYLGALNFLLLIFPSNLCCDWTMGTIPLIESVKDPRNLLTLAVALMVVCLSWYALASTNRRRSSVLITSLSLVALPFLPASNLFFPVGFVIAERVLYMPSMGYCILIAYGFELLSERFPKRLVTLLLLSLLVVDLMKTVRRNEDWRTEYSIFMSGLKVNRNNAKLFNNVGHSLENSGKYTEALRFFQKAVQVQDDDIGAHINVGRTYNHLKMFKEAELAYMKAKSLLPRAKPGETYQTRIAPNHLSVFVNLANLISKNNTRLEEADRLYRQAISMRADFVQAYINRGDVLIKLNRTKEAQDVFELALRYDKDNPDIHYNLGVVHLEQGKPTEALTSFNRALEIHPMHESALLNSAILLQELGGQEFRLIARGRLLTLLDKDHNNERVHFNLGMLAMDDRDINEAEKWFRQSVKLKSDFRSALFNLALLLADDNRSLEAEPFLSQLVRFHPDHVKGLILLGDININHLKNLTAAETCYRRILQLEPHNIQGLHNLCVVYVEQKQLLKAKACLQHATQLAPSEAYIAKHLKIVETRIEKLEQTPNAVVKERELAFQEFDASEFGGDNKMLKRQHVQVVN
ncbi:protein O-mannosyl-transferase Tmtc3 [Bradysia coprophila]|uniref:protein O-mannosyl-transferase Tmtc3 n=1 Tax=Bradysia coprophila TaxID=38358 RepID=UPI00187DCBCD|nr:protein O-mannosyl-transferase Tmtc3 [Bradysia coprophila]